MNKTRRAPDWVLDLERELPPLLDRTQAARWLRCSTKTVDRRIRLHYLGVARHGSRVLIPRSEIISLLVRWHRERDETKSVRILRVRSST